MLKVLLNLNKTTALSLLEFSFLPTNEYKFGSIHLKYNKKKFPILLCICVAPLMHVQYGVKLFEVAQCIKKSYQTQEVRYVRVAARSFVKAQQRVKLFSWSY
jgi:hypothetical protein